MNLKKVYFASDFHLGIDAKDTSLIRERKIVRWLQSISEDASVIYLLGDLFDFWYEYNHVVPKGSFRLLAKLDELTLQGIDIQIFTGNHDMWMFDYLEKELNLTIQRAPILKNIHGKLFFLGHGDGLGPGDLKYKFLKKIFRSKISQFLFTRLHPNLAFAVANYWSKHSRASNEENKYMGPDKEWLIQFALEKLKSTKIDYFVFGHRHLPITYELSPSSTYINLGDWLYHYSYAVFDGTTLVLKKYT